MFTSRDSQTDAQDFSRARLAAFQSGNVAILVAQYRDDAVVITPRGTLRGTDQIRGMIEGIVAEFVQPGVSFDLLAQTAEGPIATFVWKADTARNRYDLGSETYVIEGGKIAYQKILVRAV